VIPKRPVSWQDGGMKPPASDASLSRRTFLATGALSAAGLGLGVRGLAKDEPGDATRFPIIGFSKPFQNLTAEQTAELVTKVGWNGIECPVRAKGQIEPERAADELPTFAETLRRHHLDVHIVTTDITSMKTPQAETVLRTMARLKIQRLRLGHFLYGAESSPPARLKEITPALRDIAAACKELGLQAGFQNHSGRNYVGAPVWDIFSMIQDLDPKHIGICFDIGHATLEGGLSWPVEARLVEPFLTAVFVKDFYWKKEPAGWKDTWCPLGEGMVNRSFFNWLKKTSYRGPVCQHHEYPLGDTTEMLTHLQHDLKVLKEWLA
jgi:sugar phosphate isomerase/epimerase